MATARALLLCRHSPLSGAASRLHLHLLRPFAAAAGATLLPAAAAASPSPSPAAAARAAVRCFSSSSVQYYSPNSSNSPPKDTILLDGCDFEHWLVVMDPPPGDAANPEVSRQEIIDGYIKTLAQVLGSEEEARMKIYSVSTRHYFAFGAIVSEELSNKIKDLPKVRWVLPDSYLDVKNKDYGGEPFINGEAVPYDPKYHEEWVRNNNRANQPRRNERPRNTFRPGNFNAPPAHGFNSPPPGQNSGNMHRPPPPPYGAGFNSPPPPGQDYGNMRNMPPPPPPPPTYGAGGPPNYQPQTPSPQAGYAPGSASEYQQGGPHGYQGGNQGYQGNPGGSTPAGPGSAYQGGGSTSPYSGNPSYDGGAPAYQGQGGN